MWRAEGMTQVLCIGDDIMFPRRAHWWRGCPNAGYWPTYNPHSNLFRGKGFHIFQFDCDTAIVLELLWDWCSLHSWICFIWENECLVNQSNSLKGHLNLEFEIHVQYNANNITLGLENLLNIKHCMLRTHSSVSSGLIVEGCKCCRINTNPPQINIFKRLYKA